MHVSVREILQSKNSTLAQRIPSFIIAWMERFIHQEEINKTLHAGRDQSGVDFIETIFTLNKIGVESQFSDRIPKEGGCIIAANHPLGGLDGLALMLEVSKVRKDFLFLANDILLNISPLKELFLPVNRVGNSSRQNLAMISEAYQSGKAILIFPSGYVSRKINGVITDLPWQKSVIQKAKTHKIPIIPVFIYGQNSARFYRISRWRKFFKIKLNIEMLTLPDEMFQQRNSTIKMIFGKAISPEKLEKYPPQNMVQLVKEFVYKLPQNPNIDF